MITVFLICSILSKNLTQNRCIVILLVLLKFNSIDLISGHIVFKTRCILSLVSSINLLLVIIIRVIVLNFGKTLQRFM